MRAMEGLLITTLLLAACGRETDIEAANAAGVREPVAIAPALVAPSEVADPTEPPSYEVAIASAAADRNKSLDRCSQQPEAVRTQCEQEANAAFAEREAGLQDLRGNQQ
jgi:hypothetical protein